MRETTGAGRDFTVTEMKTMRRVSRPRHPGLRAYVHERAGYVDSGHHGYATRLLPTGRITLTLSLGPPFRRFERLGGGAGRTGPIGSLVTGLEDRPGYCEHSGGQENIRVELTPLGAYRLFGVPLAEFANGVVEFRDLFGPTADELVERLRATPDWGARFDLMDASLLARIDAGPCPSAEVAHAWRMISAARGATPITRIAHEVGWSQRHLLRKFTQQVGLTPKALARVARFQYAMRMLVRPGMRLADISHACGFYDQAHLSRDFRDLAGSSPTVCAKGWWATPRVLELPATQPLKDPTAGPR